MEIELRFEYHPRALFVDITTEKYGMSTLIAWKQLTHSTLPFLDIISYLIKNFRGALLEMTGVTLDGE